LFSLPIGPPCCNNSIITDIRCQEKRQTFSGLPAAT
jgi:hypothetical protein